MVRNLCRQNKSAKKKRSIKFPKKETASTSLGAQILKKRCEDSLKVEVNPAKPDSAREPKKKKRSPKKPETYSGGEDCSVIGLHSKLQQKQRLKYVESFGKSKFGVLLCTDVASRGLDSDEPRDSQLLVHRSGRTARIHHEGTCICIISPSNQSKWNSVLETTGLKANDIAENPRRKNSSEKQVKEQWTVFKRCIETELRSRKAKFESKDLSEEAFFENNVEV